MKSLRRASLDYDMIQPDDHLMVCVSGGKDSATLLWLLLRLQQKLRRAVPFNVTAVHLDQRQPGYDGRPLEAWLQTLPCPYKIVSEDTYSIVVDKTAAGKAYCSLCSRLRRGILYSCAEEIGATKLCLGHHGDDAAETLFLNMLHQGQLKAMPARYYSESREKHVLRPLIYAAEADIASFAAGEGFPILPCTLCGTQPDAQRAKVKLLLSTLEAMNPNARKNLVNAMGDVRPSHLLDRGLRVACGLDETTGRVVHDHAREMRAYREEPITATTHHHGGSLGSSGDGQEQQEQQSEVGEYEDDEDEEDPLMLL